MDIAVVVLLVSGLVFFTGGCIGIIRFPDFYSRLHPAGKLDTFGTLLMIAGMGLFSLHHFSLGAVFTSLKMILILVFIFFSSPTATHSIVDAGMRAGLKPWTRESRERQEEVP